MDLYKIGYFIYGVFFLFIAYKIWSNGDRIRNSKAWVVGWLGYITSILLGFDGLARSGISLVKYFI